MIQPTPFQRLLQDISKQTRVDPEAAFARLEEAYGKTTTESDLLHFAGFATNLGVGALGRITDSERLLRRCFEHPALEVDSPVRRSLHRALAVLLICADRRTEADSEVRKGIATPGDECRFAGAAAQTLLARNRPTDAIPFLRRASELCAVVSPQDDVLVQTAGIAANLMRVAEPQCLLTQELLTTAAAAAVAATARASDPLALHKALFNQGKAWLLAANPLRALAVVQELLRLERQIQSGPVQRFFSANLACRAQAVRGQTKISQLAFKACHRFAAEAEQSGEPLGPAIEELERFLAGLSSPQATPPGDPVVAAAVTAGGSVADGGAASG